ncbi:MAG: RNA polymerase sigma factor [Mucinivorans sp.]
MEIEDTDLELIAQALGGTAASYGVLFDRYRSSVRSMLNCRNETLTDDIMQETFIKAYLNLDKFNPLYSFAGWLLVIARNLLIDHTRRAWRLDPTLSVNAETTMIASVAPNPEEQVINNQNKRALEEALARLSPAYREILYLRFWSDMSYEAIAQQLSLPLGTVKTRIHRARQAFIALL